MYDTETINSKFPIRELLGKLIGKKGFNMSKYESIAMSLLNVSKKKQRFLEFEYIVDNKSGKTFIIININYESSINRETFSQLRIELRTEMIKILNKSFTNNFPPITISCLNKSEKEIHRLLNEFTHLSEFKTFLIKETFEDNISQLSFSRVTNLGSKFPTFEVVLSLQVKMFVYRDYQKKEKGTDAHANIRIDKENHLLKRIKSELQKIVNSSN